MYNFSASLIEIFSLTMLYGTYFNHSYNPFFSIISARKTRRMQAVKLIDSPFKTKLIIPLAFFQMKIRKAFFFVTWY